MVERAVGWSRSVLHRHLGGNRGLGHRHHPELRARVADDLGRAHRVLLGPLVRHHGRHHRGVERRAVVLRRHPRRNHGILRGHRLVALERWTRPDQRPPVRHPLPRGTIGNFFLGLLPDWIVAPFKAALGIASPSKVFRGYGRNIVEGLALGLGDEQSDLDRRTAGLVGPQDYSAGGGVAAALLGGQGGPQNLHVTNSLAGATIVLDVDGTPIWAKVREQIVDAAEEQRNAVVNGVGGVVFS